ncbi:MAG TPA: ATP-binding protein [Ktedonobacteraceae bacterium]|nr:ATP-binding protein [Ktedonobacteraceae bacterium]
MTEGNISLYLQNGKPFFFPIFEHVALGIAYVSLDGQWLEMNQRVCTITGYSRDELQQLSCQKLTYPEDVEHDLALFQRLLKNEIATYSIEKRYIRKDRTLVWVNLTVSLISDGEQQLFRIVTIEDIHERKQIEEERNYLLAREAQARIHSERVNEQLGVLQAITDTALAHLNLDSLFQNILSKIRDIMHADNIAVLLLDAQERYLTVRAVQGIEEAIAPVIRIPFGKGFAGTIAAQCSPVIFNANESSIEVLNPVLRQHIRSMLGVPLIVNKRVTGVVHVGMRQKHIFTTQDVEILQRVADRLALAIEHASLYEEAQRARQALQKHAHLLEEMHQQQANFIAIVSHEFRTSLTGIQGFSELLGTARLAPEEVQDFSSAIHEDALRLLRMINDLLDLEKMREGKETLHLEQVNVLELLQEQIGRCQAATREHSFHLIADENIQEIEGDRDKLSQVIANLLSNAVKYSPQGGPITLRLAQEAATIHLQVQDQGIGIPSAALDKIFHIYSRIHSESTRYIQGTGLGLSIVRHITQLHGGKVWAENAQEKGAIFHVVLPIKQPDV